MPESRTTRERLQLAFKKLKRDADRVGKNGPSISAVAREVGVSHTLIHTKYSDIADEIRNASGRGPKQQLEVKRSAIKKAQNRADELRTEVKELRVQNRGLASENARLVLLVAKLEGVVASFGAGVNILRPSKK
ncbi:TetR family transcriptional regulator [Comamonas thiooxydans]|uniref:TetR family transcriptional regulator n=1 Tax=Comamonas thiooxydans TaxID=363952 RepID=UPI00111E0844|nr:TetR family transcriptional regulator [Comamonas thiooxydans]BDR09424.1 TetR family transcriptional regulator [Comamonas thiooxydans]